MVARASRGRNATPRRRRPCRIRGRGYADVVVDRAERSGKRRRPSSPEDAAGLLDTGEVMARTGLSRQVLYQYTAMGLIKDAGTTPAGSRLYAKDVLRHLHLIKELKETGYTLKEIKEIFGARLRGGAPGEG